MKFSDVEKNINLTHGLRIPFALNEMMWGKPLAEYFNDRYGTNYNDVRKEKALDDDGIDIILSSSVNKNDKDIFIQLTHAREYDMSPSSEVNVIDTSGVPITDSLEYKCSNYERRGIDTKKIVLVIQGVLNQEDMVPLLERKDFLKPFKETECFDGIYYISDQVYPLKELDL